MHSNRGRFTISINTFHRTGVAEANGYELLRLIRSEFSLYSRQEALL